MAHGALRLAAARRRMVDYELNELYEFKSYNIMTQENREQVIQILADMMRKTAFTSEFKVVKKPKGIKVIIEVTQEQMDAMMEQMAKKRKED